VIRSQALSVSSEDFFGLAIPLAEAARAVCKAAATVPDIWDGGRWSIKKQWISGS
jgi:hypothetical protein